MKEVRPQDHTFHWNELFPAIVSDGLGVLMIWLVEGIYAVASIAGIFWLVLRIKRYLRAVSARQDAEARWAASFSEDEFQSFLETLRQKRDNQSNRNQESNNPPSDQV